jgi:hypothetical protein
MAVKMHRMPSRRTTHRKTKVLQRTKSTREGQTKESFGPRNSQNADGYGSHSEEYYRGSEVNRHES